MLEGLNFMHKSGVIHRDVKPGNTLVSEKWHLKIADFGLSKLITEKVNNNGDLTDEVCTRYFRAPELVIGYAEETYDSKIDMFSTGCVLAEMLRGKILFESEDSAEQIKRFI
jgi:serine/threonine protein kinase